MKLILVAMYDENSNTVYFRSVSNNRSALKMITEAREDGYIVAAGAITYEKSRDRAYLQLKNSLKQKIYEKLKAKI